MDSISKEGFEAIDNINITKKRPIHEQPIDFTLFGFAAVRKYWSLENAVRYKYLHEDDVQHLEGCARTQRFSWEISEPEIFRLALNPHETLVYGWAATGRERVIINDPWQITNNDTFDELPKVFQEPLQRAMSAAASTIGHPRFDREILSAGEEAASHSQFHRWIPVLSISNPVNKTTSQDEGFTDAPRIQQNIESLGHTMLGCPVSDSYQLEASNLSLFTTHGDTVEELASNLREHLRHSLESSLHEATIQRLRDNDVGENVPPFQVLNENCNVSSSPVVIAGSHTPQNGSRFQEIRPAVQASGAAEIEHPQCEDIKTQKLFPENGSPKSVPRKPLSREESGCEEDGERSSISSDSVVVFTGKGLSETHTGFLQGPKRRSRPLHSLETLGEAVVEALVPFPRATVWPTSILKRNTRCCKGRPSTGCSGRYSHIVGEDRRSPSLPEQALNLALPGVADVINGDSEKGRQVSPGQHDVDMDTKKIKATKITKTKPKTTKQSVKNGGNLKLKKAQQAIKNAGDKANTPENSYFAQTGGSAPANRGDGLEKLFESYRTKEDEVGVMGVSGVMKYLQDIAVNLEDASMFVPLEIIQAPSLGEVSKEAFVNGWKAVYCETIPKQKAYVAQQINMLSTDMALFKRVYRHVFVCAKDKGAKALPLDNAIVYWQILFAAPGKEWATPSTNWIALWVEYLNAKFTKTVNKDMWNQTFEFFLKSMQDESLSFWSEDGAWPGVIDEFVAYAKEKRGGAEPMETE